MATITRTPARDLQPGDVVEYPTQSGVTVFTVVSVEDKGNQEARLTLRKGKGKPQTFRTFIDSRFDVRS